MNSPLIVAVENTNRYDELKTAEFTAYDEGNHAIGGVDVRVTSHGYGYVHKLHVDEAHSREGIARALLNAVLIRCGDLRLEGVIAEGDAHMAAFYQSFGAQYGPSAWTDREPRESDSRRMYREPVAA